MFEGVHLSLLGTKCLLPLMVGSGVVAVVQGWWGWVFAWMRRRVMIVVVVRGVCRGNLVVLWLLSAWGSNEVGGLINKGNTGRGNNIVRE